jgi:signal transduction histidine kinase
MRRDGMHGKVTRWAVLLVLAAASVLLLVLLWQDADTRLRTELQQRAELVAQAVNPDRVESLTGTSADLDHPDYRRLKQQLSLVRAADSRIRFVYLLRAMPNGEIRIAVDSEPADSPDQTPPGQLYPEVSETLRQAVIRGTALVDGPARDRWGVWVSALAPVRSDKGAALALLGIDIDASDWWKAQLQAVLLPSLPIGLLWIVGSVLLLTSRQGTPSAQPVLARLLLPLGSLLDDFGTAMAIRAAQKGQELACGADADVPLKLRGDPARLRQVLTNLTDNAIKFTHSGEVAIRVTRLAEHVETADSADRARLRFSVRDTGIGIPPDKQQLIFEKFTQADASTTRHFGGTGLGLAISRQLVQLMGGDIEAQARAGDLSAVAAGMSDLQNAAEALVAALVADPFQPGPDPA